jgi:hypothetical protein
MSMSPERHLPFRSYGTNIEFAAILSYIYHILTTTYSNTLDLFLICVHMTKGNYSNRLLALYLGKGMHSLKVKQQVVKLKLILH